MTKKNIYIRYLLISFFALHTNALTAQLVAHIELMANQMSYQVSLIPQATWLPPFNITNSAQLTFRVPTGGFLPTDIQNINGIWQNNSQIESPIEAPTFDYFSFSLASPLLDISYEVDEPVVLFTFQNGGLCTGNIAFVDNETDPFLPPNSLAANIGNQITVLGAGPGVNAFWGSSDETGIDCPEEMLDAIPSFSLDTEGCGENALTHLSIDSIQNVTAPFQVLLDGKMPDIAQQFSNLASGLYELEIVNSDGYQTFIDIDIPSIEPPLVDLGQDIVVDLGETIRLEASHNLDSIAGIIWTSSDDLTCIDCLNPSLTALETNIYTLTLTDINGCMTTDDIRIQVKKNRAVYIPNAFSPNADGYNDVFMIYAGKAVESIEYFQVFDRWGNLLFERQQFLPNDIAHAWDGEFLNQTLSTGTYLYQAQINFIDGQQQAYSGTIQLLR